MLFWGAYAFIYLGWILKLEFWGNRIDVCLTLGFPVVLVLKNLPANAGDAGDGGSIPGLGRSLSFLIHGHGIYPWRRKWQPLQYSCLENPVDRGAWRATVHRVSKSWTWLKRLSMHESLAHHSSLMRTVLWSELRHLHCKHQILTMRPPGNFLIFSLLN